MKGRTNRRWRVKGKSEIRVDRGSQRERERVNREIASSLDEQRNT